jgi:hypothetical protein
MLLKHSFLKDMRERRGEKTDLEDAFEIFQRAVKIISSDCQFFKFLIVHYNYFYLKQLLI